MLTTNDPEVAEKARVLSLHGMDKNAYNRYQEGGSHLYDVVYPGYKFNMGELAAALGLAQLERLDQMQATRRRYAALYEEGFASIPGIKTLHQLPERENAWHLFVIQVDPRAVSYTHLDVYKRQVPAPSPRSTTCAFPCAGITTCLPSPFCWGGAAGLFCCSAREFPPKTGAYYC